MSEYWDSVWRKEVAAWHEKRDVRRGVIRIKRIEHDYKEASPNYIGDEINTSEPENLEGEILMSHIEPRHDCEDRRTCYDIPSCERNVCRTFEVSVPVIITPYAVPGEPTVNCGGEPAIMPCRKRCENRRKRHDFTVTQLINVNIPIGFGAEVCYDDTCIEDGGPCGQSA